MTDQTQAPASFPLKSDLKDPEQAELELKLTKDINAMPAEVQDRFKAIKVLYDEVNELNEEEEREHRILELKYEKLYQATYVKRAALIRGDQNAVDNALIEAFDKRREFLTDSKYPTVEVAPCDVKDIQNTAYGVSGFWLKAMLANNHVSSAIFEKDRPILGYLQDVTLDQHNDGYGFDLVFHFEKNSYFKETELKKSFVMCKQNVIEKCLGTPITWMSGCDVTKTKKKKGKGKKKTMVTVKCDSFFNFFETVEAEQKPKKPVEEDEEEGDEEAAQMDEDFDLGTTFRDDLIPLALEYYLGVIEQDQGSEGDDEDGDDDDEDDDDEDDKAKKSKPKPKPSAPSQAGGAPGDKQECKQQ